MAASGYTAYLFDSSCFLYKSTDLGTTWTESQTPDPTLGDFWAILELAYLDGDLMTMVGVDAEYLGNENNGALGLSTAAGITGSWTILNPQGAAADGTIAHPQSFYSCAISNDAQIILALPTPGANSENQSLAWPDLSLSYPRISRDQGATWSDITALGSGRTWLKACFNKNATIMYMVSVVIPNVDVTAIISKSSDGGTTWADLATVPFLPSSQVGNHQKIRCSSDGQVVLYADQNGDVFLSKDGGATWIIVNSFNGIPPDFDPITILPAQVIESTWADCGLSDDGKVMIVIFGDFSTDIIADYPYQSAAFISTDTGTTWTQLMPSGITNSGGTNIAQACNVSPDGSSFIIGYQNETGPTYFADLSTNQGGTFTLSDMTSFVSPLGETWNSAYFFAPVVPAPKGGYIIERLDDRIWPTVENCWCIDCGFTLAQPTPAADLAIVPVS